jgi:hypothetical protein
MRKVLTLSGAKRSRRAHGADPIGIGKVAP